MEFGVGDAYRTPFPFHLLNVRAHDMSAFADEATHFVDWLKARKDALKFLPQQDNIEQQFVPRMLYRAYLQSLLAELTTKPSLTANFVGDEIIDVLPGEEQAMIVAKSGITHTVDQVVFAIGNNPASPFPFPVNQTKTILNPWDYQAPTQIATHENVLIIGTGLSMIDAVRTLQEQKHHGKIYALSRHGLLPLPQSEGRETVTLDIETLPKSLRPLLMMLRECSETHVAKGGDWRSVINTLRPNITFLWQRLSLQDKKRFLRHALSYWNVHRHRVPKYIYDLLQSLQEQGQLQLIAGRVMRVNNREAFIVHRHETNMQTIDIDWVVNCMGPRMSIRNALPACGKRLYELGKISLDPLQLGFNTNEVGAIYNKESIASDIYFSLGSPTKGVNWECTAVPDIRKQSYLLAQHLVKG